MPTFGKLDEYNETEDWRHYIERVNHFFEANEITSSMMMMMMTDPGKRRFIFLVCVRAKTYKLVRSLVAREDLKDKSYEDLAKLLQDHSCLNLRLLFSDSSLFNQVRPLQNQHFQIPIRSGTHGHVLASSYELLSDPWVNKLQFPIYNVFS